ncbi:outer membrane lipoprotein LolB [Piscinibacter sakaiensis]|uniref:outer membrane lipoprotein LolB n=1 Tax=Piscinibacter sakaiensis TaxID=1547922 RepID=UPI003AABFA6E
MPIFFRWLAASLLIALLAGCASAPPADPAERLSGRLAVRVAGDAAAAERSMTVAFELRGDPQRGRIEFSTPLGSVVARASWTPGEVLLVTEQGEQRFADLDRMSQEVLGEVVPVAALFDWLRGRPWPGAPSRVVTGGFAQLGWTVDLTRFADALIIARRDAAPVVTVRAIVDSR